MTPQNKIAKYGLGKVILDLSLHHTVGEIIDIVTEKHGIKLSYNTVQRFLVSVRSERAEQTRQVVKEHIKKTVPRDLEIVDKVILKLEREFDASTGRGIPMMSKALLDAIKTKLDYCGAEKTGGVIVDVTEWRELLKRKCGIRD